MYNVCMVNCFPGFGKRKNLENPRQQYTLTANNSVKDYFSSLMYSRVHNVPADRH